MTSDEIGQELHDRATRGTPLSAQEQAQLTEWYAQQDEGEAAALARTATPGDLVKLRHDVDRALARLQSVTHHVQALASENETLKQEIATLQRRLQKNAQPA